METKYLIEHLHEWHENLISEMCADDVLTCDDLCGYPGPCIVIQAANLLEAQQKRIAELESALREQGERRWIPVTERLPEESGDYIVYYSNAASNKPLISMRHFYGETPEAFLRNKAMTHWMPLPEIPKEETP